MARLFAPVQGRLRRDGGRLLTAYGHDLSLPWWQGAELGFLEDRDAARLAVAEVRSRGLPFGVHHPLVAEPGALWAPFWLAPKALERARALKEAVRALQEGAALGAAYVLFHFPWPALVSPSLDLPALGWRLPPEAQAEALWPRDALAELSDEVFGVLERAGGAAGTEVLLELDGPAGAFYGSGGELWDALCRRHPGIGLCADTGRLDLLGRTHGFRPLAFLRSIGLHVHHLHLMGARWERGENHLPPLPEQEGRAGYAPAAAMARLVLGMRPDLPVVLEVDPRTLPPADLVRSLRYCAALGGGPEPGTV